MTLVQVLGRQVALGEDEEAPEDPGAVGQSIKSTNILTLIVVIRTRVYSYKDSRI